MKRVWKGVIIGGVVGFVFSLLLMKFGSSESIFRIPLTLVLKVVSQFEGWGSDVLGFVIFGVFFITIFYTLVGIIVGALVVRLRKRDSVAGVAGKGTMKKE